MGAYVFAEDEISSPGTWIVVMDKDTGDSILSGEMLVCGALTQQAIDDGYNAEDIVETPMTDCSYRDIYG